MQIRMATEADIERLARMGCESFPWGYTYEERLERYRAHPRYKLEDDVLIGEVDGQIVAALHGIPFTVWIGGARMPMYGIAGVVNALEARRRGYASALCIAAIQRNRARYPISMLYPFRYDFYRKLGWGAVGELVEYNFHPRNLPRYEAYRQVRRFHVDDMPRVAACYQRFVERGNCLAERPQPVWQKWLSKIEQHKMIAMVYERDGEIYGYLTFNFEPGHTMLTQLLAVEELIYDDHQSYQGLLGFLSSLRDQVAVVRYWARPDEGLHLILNDPRDVGHPVLAGLVSRAGQYGASYMLRVLDVAAALAARPNYNHVSGAICFQIRDGQIQENNGCFRFGLKDGRPTVTAGRDDQLTYVNISIDIFSQLYAGAITAERAYFLGLLEITRREALVWLDTALRLPRPFLLDQF